MSTTYDNIIHTHATIHALDEKLVKAIIATESSFDPAAHSPAGAVGLMQLMPSTYAELAYGSKWRTVVKDKGRVHKELLDPDTNIQYGCAYLSGLLGQFGGNKVLAIAAYNAGPGRISGIIAGTSKPLSDITYDDIKNKLPQETRDHIPKVSGHYSKCGGTSFIDVAPTDTSGVDPQLPKPTKDMPAVTLFEELEEPTTSEVVYDAPDEEVTPDFFKLGDVVLRVPPQNISIQESNTTYTFPTVRTKGSPKFKTGEGRINITVDCMFPSLEDINGYFDTTGVRRWMGGLRSIVAQYYRAPFLPLENPTIRKVLLPNEPWIPTEESMSQLTNDRARLQEHLQVESDKSAQGAITNMIRAMDSQIKVMNEQRADQLELEGQNTWEGEMGSGGGLYDDVQLGVVLDSFSVSTVPGFPRSLKCVLTLVPFNYLPFSNTLGFVRTMDDAREQTTRYNNLLTGQPDEGDEIMPVYNPSESIPFLRYYRALLSEWQAGKADPQYMIGDGGVCEVHGGPPLLEPMAGESDNIRLTYHFTTENRMTILRREVELAKAELAAVRKAMGPLVRTNIPKWPWERFYCVLTAYVAMVGDLAHVGDTIKRYLGVEGYEKVVHMIFSKENLRWYEVSDYIQNIVGDDAEDFLGLMEELLDMELDVRDVGATQSVTVELGGAMNVVTGVTATYRNKVTPIKLVGQMYPTCQYMGSADVQFTVNLQTTSEDFLSELRLLSLRTNYTQRLKGILSRGDMGEIEDTSAVVEGELFQLLGVRQVLVTDVTYSNVDGQPGLFNVQMNMVQADMDLDDYEALVGGKVVTAELFTMAMDILARPGLDLPDPWEEYSHTIGNAKLDIRLLEMKAADRSAALDRDEATLRDQIASLEKDGLSWWEKIVKGIAEGAYSFGRSVTDPVANIIEAKRELPGRVLIFETSQKVKRSLSIPSHADALAEFDEEFKVLLEENRRTLDERGNPCYADLGLPLVTTDLLDTPADFYFTRDALLTEDSITEELAMIRKYSHAKLEESFLLNFQGAEDIWPEGGEHQEFRDKLTRIKDAILSNPSTSWDDLQGKFLVENIQATQPKHVHEIANSLLAAGRIVAAERHLKELEGGRGAFEEILRRNTTNVPGERHSGYMKRMLEGYDSKVDGLRTYIAENSLPNGLITPDGIYNTAIDWGAGMSFNSVLESEVVQAQGMEARRRDQTLQMARAFPAIKLYFIEEDAPHWLLFDDYYSYSAIRSVDIIQSRKAASSTAVISLSNVQGNLTDPKADYQRENISMADTVEEQQVDSLMLRVGCPIMIRMGYHNDPKKLEMTFLGAIVELKPGEGQVEIVAQGWGAQLNTPVAAKGGEEVGMWDWRKSHGDVVTWALNQVPGMRHFGQPSIFDHTSDVIRAEPIGVIKTGLINMITGMEMGGNNPRDDNIYFPYNSSWSTLSHPTFDWNIDPGQTPWEVIQEILLWYPDWIATVLPYQPHPDRLSDTRLTLYVGPQDGYYKWTDEYADEWQAYQDTANPLVEYGAEFREWRSGLSSTVQRYIPEESAEDLRTLRQVDPSRPGLFFTDGEEGERKLRGCFRPVIRHHFYDSGHHIIDNKIKASVDNMANRVIVSYPSSDPIMGYEQHKFSESYEMVLDDNILEDHLRAYLSYQKNVDTNWWANWFQPMILAHKVRHGGGTEKDIRAGIPMYIRVANMVLSNQVREMYTGELTVIGDPTVKPWDKVYLYDFENSMVGPFQVEQVIHHFSEETGYITTITPDIINHVQNFGNTLNTSYVNQMYALAALRGLGAAATGGLLLYGGRAGARLGGPLLKGLVTTAFPRIAASAAFGAAVGWIPVVGWAMWGGWTLYSMAKGMGLTFQKEFGKLMGRQPIHLTPIMYNGKPLLAGTEGMRTDDIWVHMQDKISSFKDLPGALLSAVVPRGK